MREDTVLGIIFSNMHDDTIGELTNIRTMGSVPFGGRYRFIDFPLSNMVNSGITNVGVVTKSNYQSLLDHIGSGREWDLSRKVGGLNILPPFSNTHSGIYRGRLQALAGISDYIESHRSQYVLMVDCDIISNVDYREMTKQHIASGADITVMYQKLDMARADLLDDTTAFGFDSNGRINDVMIGPTVPGTYNIYQNVTVISRELLCRIISETSQRNQISFKKEILQNSFDRFNIQGFENTSVSLNIHSLKSYFDANMKLLDPAVRSAVFNPQNPIYTKIKDEVPAKYGTSAQVSNSLVADGCIIDGTVENSIIFRGVKIARGAVVKNCILMQGTTVNEGCNLNYVISDKDVTVRENRMLMGFETYPIYISKGSVV